MKQTKIYQTTNENLIYLVLSLAVLVLRLGFTPIAFISWIVSFALASSLTTNMIGKHELCPDRLHTALWAIVIVWAITALIFHWSLGWYFFGIAIYMVSGLIHAAILAKKNNKNFLKILIEAEKRAAKRAFGDKN